MDVILTKKNEDFISLKQVTGEHWKGWTGGLNNYYRNTLPGTILVNHVFTFGDSNSPTVFRQLEYCDLDFVEELDLYPTRRSKTICLGLSFDERAEDLESLPDCLDVLPTPSLSTEKVNKCRNKLRPFAPTKAARQYYNLMTPEHQ